MPREARDESSASVRDAVGRHSTVPVPLAPAPRQPKRRRSFSWLAAVVFALLVTLAISVLYSTVAHRHGVTAKGNP